jgi:arginase
MVAAHPVRLLQVPYDSGHFDVRMGAGPFALARAGAAVRLRAQGHAVEEQVLHPSTSWCAELASAFQLHRAIAAAVAAAHQQGQVPLLLAGNCNTTIGMLAAGATPGQRLGLVWLDAHGDFNTSDTDANGFLDGHALAMAVGRCWRAATGNVPGFHPLPEQRVMLLAARSLDDDEEPMLRQSAVTWLPPAMARNSAAVHEALRALADHADVVHVHVDLDVHDPSIAPANGYAAPDGLSADDVARIVRQTADVFPVISATLAAYDPAYDPHGRMRDTALSLLEVMASVASQRPDSSSPRSKPWRTPAAGG